MNNRKLARDEWKRYFDFVSKMTLGKQVEVEIDGNEIGAQPVEEWVYLEGFSYDPKDDAFYVHTRLFLHHVPQPQEIFVTELGAALSAVGVKDREGRWQIIKLRSPLSLTASRASDASPHNEPSSHV